MKTVLRFLALAVLFGLAINLAPTHRIYAGHGGYGGGFGGFGGGFGGGGFNWGSLLGGGGGWGGGGHHHGHHFGGGGGGYYPPLRNPPPRTYTPRVYTPRNTPPRLNPPPVRHVTPKSNPLPNFGPSGAGPKTFVRSNPPKSPPVLPKSNMSALIRSTAPHNPPPKVFVKSTAPPHGPQPTPHQLSTHMPTAPTTPAVRPNSQPTMSPKAIAQAPESLAPSSHGPQTKPTPNVSVRKTFTCSLPPGAKKRMQEQIGAKTKGLIDQIDSITDGLVNQLVGKLPGGHELSPSQLQDLLDAIDDGDLDRVRDLLGPGGSRNPIGQQLLGLAGLQEALDDLRNGDNRGLGQGPGNGINPLAEGGGIGTPMGAVTGGGVGPGAGRGPNGGGNPQGPGAGRGPNGGGNPQGPGFGGGRGPNGGGNPQGPGAGGGRGPNGGGNGGPGPDIVNLFQQVNNFFPPNIADPINQLIGQIAVNLQVQMWLDQMPLGPAFFPPGPDVPIALIPGLPQGLIIPTGFGPTMVGMGPGDQIFLGQGDVTEVAGMPEPVGPPVADLAAPVPAGRLVLTNVSQDVINYNVNQQPFAMQPRFQQVLTDAPSWVVEFDRGGGNGMARYTLTEGTYEFTPTQTGWDLFRKTFRVQLENMLDADFNYVVSDQQQVIGPSEMQDLSGPLAPVISFDNGRGQTLTKQLDGTAYRIALAEDDTFNIYPAESVPTPSPQTVEVPVVTPGPAPADVVATMEPSPAMSAPVALGTEVAAAAPIASFGPATTMAAAPAMTPATMVSTTRVAPLSIGSRRVNMPSGFRLFDPVAALSSASTDTTAGRRAAPARQLPFEFSLFEAAQAAQRATTGGL